MTHSSRIVVLTVIASALLSASSLAAWRSENQPLILSETPPGERGQGRPGAEQLSSEHRAVANRILYLNARESPSSLDASVLRADGSLVPGALIKGNRGWTLRVDTRPMDGSMDGIFNLYVVERAVADGTLRVRVAKANMINHSCGWRHPFKFDHERLRARTLDSIPLEITADHLWDANFHSKTMSGDRIMFRVLSYGKPVPAAQVVIETGSGWNKTLKTDADGKVEVQLIRDYFPERWPDFDNRKRGSVLITATSDMAEQGVFAGTPYNRVRMVSTLPWKYLPPRQEYTSYAWGLGIAALFVVVAGAGTYAYRERRNKPYREGGSDEQD